MKEKRRAPPSGLRGRRVKREGPGEPEEPGPRPGRGAERGPQAAGQKAKRGRGMNGLEDWEGQWAADTH